MELVKNDDLEVAIISETDVPAIIQSQFTKMQDAKQELSLAQDKAHIAQSSAYGTKDSKAGLFKNKQAIESLQDVAVELADAQLASTQAQVKAFEYQQTLAEITKYLFGLGVTNIAMNRCVVKELEMRLDQASEEEIDEMTASEITNVVKQLKAQEDVMVKQTELSRIVREQDDSIEELTVKNRLLNEKIETLEEKNQSQDNRIRLLVEENYKKRYHFTLLCVALGLGALALIIAIIGCCI